MEFLRLLSLISFLLCVWLCSFSILVSGATFTLLNRCPVVVWPVIAENEGTSVLPALSPDNFTSVQLASRWVGRFWGLIGCSSNSSSYCDSVNGTRLATTLAEFSLDPYANNVSLYDLSLVDGFNLPLTISPKNSSCGSPSCVANALEFCPPTLRVSDGHGTALACSSPCTESDNISSACNNYTQTFRQLCTTAFTSPSDSSYTFVCSDTDFTINYCSGANLQSATPPLSPVGPAIVTSSYAPETNSPISRSIPPLQYSPPQPSHSLQPALVAGLVSTGVFVIVGLICLRLILTRRNRRHKNDGEQLDISVVGPQRFKYRELYSATKGFNTSELLGQGGQGQVYRGILRRGGLQVAVKKVAAGKEARAMRDLVSELRIISKLSHENLVQLQGWCKHRGKLLVVYEYMPKGSLDKLLFKNNEVVMDWDVRYRIICGLGAALLYLHEEWEKRVVHRDVKPSNIMLDANFEAKLGDFGLARLIDPDVVPPSTTTAAGTIGYIAPEIVTTRLPTAESDVYSFGIVALELACGRQSFQVASESGSIFLLDKVRNLNKEGRVMEAVDRRLAGVFNVDEMERLFAVGLAATDSDPTRRPSTRQVLAILTKEAPAAPSL